MKKRIKVADILEILIWNNETNNVRENTVENKIIFEYKVSNIVRDIFSSFTSDDLDDLGYIITTNFMKKLNQVNLEKELKNEK
jgi:hypothetical protein